MTDKILSFEKGQKNKDAAKAVDKKSKEKLALLKEFEEANQQCNEFTARLNEMVHVVDGSYDEVREKAIDKITDEQLELVRMRRQKFYSPKERKKILEELKELHGISKEYKKIYPKYEAAQVRVIHAEEAILAAGGVALLEDILRDLDVNESDIQEFIHYAMERETERKHHDETDDYADDDEIETEEETAL